ncbi:MAG: tyrosine-type recombinase/integrase [Cetobacterium sp.]
MKTPAKPIKNKRIIFSIQDFLRTNGRYGERNYMLFIIGITTGYRVGDLLELTVKDIKKSLNSGYFKVLEGKKEKQWNIKKEHIKTRDIKIQPALRKELLKYIEGKKDYEVMFPSNKGRNEPIQVKQATRILKDAAEEFGLESITSHSLRKTYSYIIYNENDKDITVVQELLGHSSPEITKRYIGIDREEKDKQSKCLNGFISPS